MARRTETREIGIYRYQVTQLKVRAAHRVLTKFVKVFGEALGTAADGLGETEKANALIGDLSRGQVGKAARAVVDNLGDEDINWLIDQIKPTIKYQTPPMAEANPDAFVTLPDWDEHFAGALLEEFKLIGFVLELNFADFFGALGGNLQSAVHKFTTPVASN